MIINVKVKPNAGKDEVRKISVGVYEVFVKERAEEDKANKRVINLLAKELNVNWRLIKIKNPKSRDKIIEIKE